MSKKGVFALAFAFLAANAMGQLASDIVPRQRIVPRSEEIQRDLDESRYHLGPVRLKPMFALRDLGYNNNVFGTESDPVADWTATVAGGARWTLPFGPKMYLRGDVMPEYTYFQKLTERRFVGGTYSGSVVGLFNRLSLEATGTTAKNLSIVSSEIETPAILKRNDVTFDGELEILRRLSIFGRAETQTLRYGTEGTADLGPLRIDELDRDESATRGGVRYRFRSFLDLSVAAENTSTEFDVRPQDRDNSSDAIIVALHYDRPRAYANISVGDRKGKPANGSAFPEYETTTGSYFLSYSLVAPVELQAYGQKRVVYGVFTDYPYFFETRNGGALVVKPGTRFAIRMFGEGGQNEYAHLVRQTSAERNDDVVTYGGGFAVRLYRNLVATVVVSQSDYQSNIGTFDRSILRVQTGLSLNGGLR